jgi:hypothetical protein
LVQGNQEVYPETHCGSLSKNEMPGSAWQLSAHCSCEKGHPCTSTDERQLTDWHEQVATWCDMYGLVYSHSNVCLLIQWNYIELQPSVNVSILVMWLFDHPV